MRLLRRDFGPSLDVLVVGLGNPGPEYAATRHNLGFMVTDRLASEWSASWRSKFSGRVAETRDGDLRLALLQPLTFMNLSGRSVAAAPALLQARARRAGGRARRDRPGRWATCGRSRAGGSRATTACARCATSLGTAEFVRVRIGVGRPERGDRQPVADWLLRPFPADVDVDALVTRGAECTRVVVRDGVDEAMRRFNGAGPL